MVKWIMLVLFVLPVMARADVNRDDLLKCRSYSDPVKRSQCVQALKSQRFRVASSKCKETLSCWSKRYREQAVKHCRLAFARRAQMSSFWAQHYDGQDFDKVRWFDRGTGSMVYYEQEAGKVLQCRFYPKTPSRVKVSIAPAR